jgi:hypothetical protein
MTVARSQLVDTNVTPRYHVISGTVRGALLLGEGGEDRKAWIENRLEGGNTRTRNAPLDGLHSFV